MTRAEEILSSKEFAEKDKAMTWAMSIHAQELAEWCGNNSWIRSNNITGDGWRRVENNKWVYKTTSELYTIFNNQNKQDEISRGNIEAFC